MERLKDASAVFCSQRRCNEALYCNYSIFDIGPGFTRDESTYLCNSHVLPSSSFHHPISSFQLCFVSESQQLICQFLISILENVIGTLKQAHSFILAIFSWHAPKRAYQPQHYCPPESSQDTTGFSENHIYMHTSSFILYLKILRSRREDTRNSGGTCRSPGSYQ